MATKAEVNNAYYDGMYEVISAQRADLSHVVRVVNGTVLDSFREWLLDNGQDNELVEQIDAAIDW